MQIIKDYSQENSCYKQSFSFSTYITFPVSCTMGDNNILGTGWLNSPTGVENPTGFGSVYERSELFTTMARKGHCKHKKCRCKFIKSRCKYKKVTANMKNVDANIK